MVVDALLKGDRRHRRLLHELPPLLSRVLAGGAVVGLVRAVTVATTAVLLGAPAAFFRRHRSPRIARKVSGKTYTRVLEQLRDDRELQGDIKDALHAMLHSHC